MRRALYILAIVLISACGSRNRNANSDSDDIEVTVLESDDGKIRISGWEEPHSGAMGVYGSRIEYKWNGFCWFPSGTPLP